MTAAERREKKRVVVESLRNGSTRAAACRAARIDRKTFYVWLRKDSRWAARVEEALTAQIGAVEDALFEAALAGDVKAQIHFLRCRAPEKWEPNLRRDVAVDIKAKAEIDWAAVRREIEGPVPIVDNAPGDEGDIARPAPAPAGRPREEGEDANDGDGSFWVM